MFFFPPYSQFSFQTDKLYLTRTGAFKAGDIVPGYSPENTAEQNQTVICKYLFENALIYLRNI
jgi:hypothetical protein